LEIYVKHSRGEVLLQGALLVLEQKKLCYVETTCVLYANQL